METRLISRRRRASILATVAWLLVAAAPADRFDTMIAAARADMLAAPQAAADRAAAALRLAGPDASAERQATGLWLQGEALNRMGRPKDALPLLSRAHALVEKGGRRTLLRADILLSEGSALTDAARITEALGALQQAHALFLELGQARSRAKALILIAMLYDTGRDHEAALRYFQQAEDAYDADPGLLIAIQYGRGTALHELGRWKDAERAFIATLATARRIGAPASQAQALGNIANERLSQGRVGEAEAAIGEGMALARGPSAVEIRHALLPFAAIAAFRRGDIARAAGLIGERFRGVDPTRTVVPDRDAHETAYDIYRAQGNDALALQHLAALKRLDDQATQIARSTGAALAAARFDYTNQELRIAKLKATDLARTVAFERQSARTQRNLFISVMLTILLVLGLLTFGLFTIRRSRNHVRAANADLETTNGKLEKALAAKTEFLATTSHEIRTPLNGILGMTQVLIADRALDAGTRERLSVVHGAGVTMRALVDDILDVAKIETGKMTVERAPMDLVATVEQAASIWRDQAGAKGLAFAVQHDVTTRWILGDAARLRQIVFNLLSNAVKFTAAGHVTVTLREADGRLRLAVADTGIGIDAAAHELIFESFRQADAGTTRQYGGTGLGLSISRNLARAMEGDVTVASREGEGATFMLDLPLVAATGPAEAVEDAALLVVDRNPISRAMFASLFAGMGPVVFAGDAAEAARVAGERRPARVLVDAPSLGGPEALAALAAADMAVCVLLPDGESVARDRWLAAGAHRVLVRPIGKKQLIAEVTSLATALVPEAA